jgi:dihydroorotate dehydrogenase (fumarate)
LSGSSAPTRSCAWLDDRRGCAGDLRGVAIERLHAVEDTVPLTFDFDATICTKCDLCVVLCPYDAREMEGEAPKSPDLKQILLEDRCRYCGLCVEVCKPAALTYGNWPR